MNNDGFASLSRFKMDRSTKDSRQAEYLKSKIRIPKSKIGFLSFFSLIRLDASGQRQRSCKTTIQMLELIPS
ncbi:hypothetical protein D1AOALGA4SA_10555 [Olavius algarvensis Delta 1 endosymbiont]|nr:hypothetical protein D1AOALGA4SA_10555 [Olavius algarvensis Delta 1 endosymbiont]